MGGVSSSETVVRSQSQLDSRPNEHVIELQYPFTASMAIMTEQKSDPHEKFKSNAKEQYMFQTFPNFDLQELKKLFSYCYIDINAIDKEERTLSDIFVFAGQFLNQDEEINEIKKKVVCYDLKYEISSLENAYGNWAELKVYVDNIKGLTLLHKCALRTNLLDFLAEGAREISEKKILSYAKFLLKNGANKNILDAGGNSILHHVAKTSSVKFARLLIDNKTSFTQMNNDELNVLEIAIKYKRTAMYDFLMRAKEHFKCKNVPYDFNEGFSKYWAVRDLVGILAWFNKISPFDINHKQIFSPQIAYSKSYSDYKVYDKLKEFLTKKCIDFTIKEDGTIEIFPLSKDVGNVYSFLHIICATEIFNCVYFKFFETPIHSGNELDLIVLKIIELGIDVDAIDHLGNSALHVIAKSNSLSVAKILIGAGADVKIKNLKDQTAYDIALKYGSTEMSDYLKLVTLETLESVVSTTPPRLYPVIL